MIIGFMFCVFSLFNRVSLFLLGMCMLVSSSVGWVVFSVLCMLVMLLNLCMVWLVLCSVLVSMKCMLWLLLII